MQDPVSDASAQDAALVPCVLVFNSNDPSGAGGISADVLTIASTGAHTLTVMTGTYVRDTAEIFDHFPLDDEVVSEQARSLLQDVRAQAIKVGFVGTPENLSVIATLAADYPDLPLVAYMPNLSWWNEVQSDLYQDAFQELLLPQTTLLVGNHGTLWRWLLPDWSAERSPSARDLARAAGEFGVPYTLITGIPAAQQHIENILATPQTVLAREKFERFEAVFTGAGETLSAMLAALLANACDLGEAFAEALGYLDQCLDNGFRPGMGHAIPDRLFWGGSDEEASTVNPENTTSTLELPPHDTQH